MTFFAGETLEVLLTNADVSGVSRPVLIVQSATDRETVWQADVGVPALASADVTLMQLTIAAADGSVVAADEVPYSTGKAGWSLLWNVVGAGRYTAWATVDGVSGVRSWEFGTIRVKANKLDLVTVDGGEPEPPGEVIDGGTATLVGAGVMDGGTV